MQSKIYRMNRILDVSKWDVCIGKWYAKKRAYFLLFSHTPVYQSPCIFYHFYISEVFIVYFSLFRTYFSSFSCFFQHVVKQTYIFKWDTLYILFYLDFSWSLYKIKHVLVLKVTVLEIIDVYLHTRWAKKENNNVLIFFKRTPYILFPQRYLLYSFILYIGYLILKIYVRFTM